MRERGVYLVPTLFTAHQIGEQGGQHGAPDWVLNKGNQLADMRGTLIARALAEDVRITLGTDCSGAPLSEHGRNAAEAEYMVRGGMSPAQAITAGTYEAASALRLEHELGSLQPGRLADIIAVQDDPLADVRTLQDVHFVMKAGDIVADRTRQTVGRQPAVV
jgi:imidazolonepropionase-like amidohydrolase